LPDVVLELKYAIEDDFEARGITQYIGARLSKNSKYVNGINLLYHPEFHT
jgi:sulfur transfer complex TusBCD TusB component (DsrH family)